MSLNDKIKSPVSIGFKNNNNDSTENSLILLEVVTINTGTLLILAILLLIIATFVFSVSKKLSSQCTVP